MEMEEFSLWLSGLRTQCSVWRTWVQSLVTLSGYGSGICRKLWRGSQMQLRSGVALAVGRPAAVALIRPLDWELPYATGVAVKEKRQREKERENRKGEKMEERRKWVILEGGSIGLLMNRIWRVKEERK